jgi:hypothetical protein
MDKSEDWEAEGQIPNEVYAKCARDGLLVPISGGKSIPKEWEKYGIIAGIKAEEWDGFHDFILWDELLRGGAIASIFIGLVRDLVPKICNNLGPNTNKLSRSLVRHR